MITPLQFFRTALAIILFALAELLSLVWLLVTSLGAWLDPDMFDDDEDDNCYGF